MVLPSGKAWDQFLQNTILKWLVNTSAGSAIGQVTYFQESTSQATI